MGTVPERRPRAVPRVGRSATIHIRAPQQTKDLIETAAFAMGKSLSEFTLESARPHAVNVLLDQRLFVVEPKQYDAFMRALDDPPSAGSKLKALMKRRPLWRK
jgi:uncharacterized protein (DUF1778 family)